MTNDNTMFRVQCGIADIDSYSMLFYGNYMRYNERAANACLSQSDGQGGCAMLKAAHFVKYTMPVRWNDVVDVRSTLLGEPKEHEATLLQEWLVEGRVIHACYATYKLHNVATGMPSAMLPDKAATRRVMVMDKEPKMAFEAGESFTAGGLVTPDMINFRSQLSVSTIVDMMERRRTDMLGGQAELERLQKEEGVAVCAYIMQDMELHATPVLPGDALEVASGYYVQNDMFYCYHHTLKHQSTGRLISGGQP